MNRYHRFLDIRDYIPNIDTSKYQTEGMRWPEFHKQLQFKDLGNDKILPWLNSLGFTSHWIEFFYTPPHDDGVIHSDNVYYADWAKLIFQFGAKGSTMRWWTSNEIINHDTGQGKILISKPENSTLQYEVEIGTSSLVNVGPLHSSHNDTNQPRFAITLALFHLDKKRVLWEDALEILSEYIEK